MIRPAEVKQEKEDHDTWASVENFSIDSVVKEAAIEPKESTLGRDKDAEEDFFKGLMMKRSQGLASLLWMKGSYTKHLKHYDRLVDRVSFLEK